MRCHLLIPLLVILGVTKLYAVPRPLTVMLWEAGPPGMAAGAKQGADDGSGRYWDVGIPSMWIYTPDSPAPEGGRIALIACCGGGYTHLTRLVGADGAVDAFLPKNVVVVALRYRTTPPSKSAEEDALEDGKRAIRLLRAHAKEWKINPDKIGIFGWSAGANLALNVASHFDEGDAQASDPVARFSSRPNFVAMLSPWPNRPPRSIDQYPISKNAPPAFIASAEDDTTAPVSFARSIAQSYKKADVAHSLWVTETGGHGAFTIDAAGEGGHWIERFWPWLREIGIHE